MKPDTRSHIEEKIKQLLISDLKVSPATIADTNSATPLLGRGIGLDSVETMALVVSLEEEFEISIPDDELTVDLFKSVGSLTDYIMRALLETTNGSKK
ncbi:MAG: acyl carrier protein [Candidatus Binatia bacterium]